MSSNIACCLFVRSRVEVYCTFLDSVFHKIRWHNRKPHQIFIFIENKRFLSTALTVICFFISLFPAIQPKLPSSLFSGGKSDPGVKLATRPLVLRLRIIRAIPRHLLYTLMVCRGHLYLFTVHEDRLLVSHYCVIIRSNVRFDFLKLSGYSVYHQV